jgi:hypothetical protein
MINVTVWSHNTVDIENKSYPISSQEDMITFLHDLIYKVTYGGERVCLERARIDEVKGEALYTEIKRFE